MYPLFMVKIQLLESFLQGWRMLTELKCVEETPNAFYLFWLPAINDPPMELINFPFLLLY